jgi:arylformamidase
MKNYDAKYEPEFNLRARHPDFEVFVERWRRESEKARKTLECRIGEPYGDGLNMALDIFPCSGPSNPVFIFIHGGYWRAMDKDLFAYPALGFNAAGAVYVSINYALAPAVTLDVIVEQCREAVIWVHRNAAMFGGDPKRIHVGGHSAGGHLTAMMMSTDWTARGSADIALSGGVPISGIFDLLPLIGTSINDDVRLDQEAALRNSPMSFVPENGAPIIAAVGADETDEFVRQSRDYAKAWTAQGGSALFLPIEGLHHFDVVLELGRTGSKLNDAVLSQMGV